MRGFLGLSGGEEAGQCSALQPSRQGLLCLPSSSSSHPTSASPFPSSLTTLVLEHTGLSLLVLSWYLALPVWPAMATPTSAGSDKGHLPHLSHRSQFPSARCLLCWAARQEHPGTFHRLMPLLAGKGCVFPAHPSAPLCSTLAVTEPTGLLPTGMEK